MAAAVAVAVAAADATANATTSNTALVTVFEDPVNFNAKHPLNGRWTLWFDNPNNKRPQSNNWDANLKNLITIDTVEDFWGVYNNTVNPLALPFGSNYHFFRDGIKPAWEDPKNANGGKWTISIPKSQRDTQIDSYWMNTIVSCVGELAQYSDVICGVVCSARRSVDRISIWLSTGDQTKCEAIGRHVKEACGIPDDEKIKYEMHPKDPHSKPIEKYVV